MPLLILMVWAFWAFLVSFAGTLGVLCAQALL
jgi:hypothetical protein